MLLHSLLKVLDIFSISIWYEEESTETNMIGIKCNNFIKTTSHICSNEELNEFVTPFILIIVLQRVSL